MIWKKQNTHFWYIIIQKIDKLLLKIVPFLCVRSRKKTVFWKTYQIFTHPITFNHSTLFPHFTSHLNSLFSKLPPKSLSATFAQRNSQQSSSPEWHSRTYGNTDARQLDVLPPFAAFRKAQFGGHAAVTSDNEKLLLALTALVRNAWLSKKIFCRASTGKKRGTQSAISSFAPHRWKRRSG